MEFSKMCPFTHNNLLYMSFAKKLPQITLSTTKSNLQPLLSKFTANITEDVKNNVKENWLEVNMCHAMKTLNIFQVVLTIQIQTKCAFAKNYYLLCFRDKICNNWPKLQKLAVKYFVAISNPVKYKNAIKKLKGSSKSLEKIHFLLCGLSIWNKILQFSVSVSLMCFTTF